MLHHNNNAILWERYQLIIRIVCLSHPGGGRAGRGEGGGTLQHNQPDEKPFLRRFINLEEEKRVLDSNISLDVYFS